MQKQRYSAEEEQSLMTRLWSPIVKDDPEAFVIGVDPARSGLDSTVIAVRKGRDLIELRRHG